MDKLSKTEQRDILCGRLKELREQADLTQQHMADQLGIARDRYQKYEGRTLIPRDLAEIAAGILDVNPLYLMSVSSVKEKLPSPRQTVAKGAAQTMPVEAVGIIKAGFFSESHELPPDDRVVLYVPVDTPYADKPLRGLKVSGPSMDREYADGSYVVVCPAIYLGNGWMPASGQHVVVQRRAPGSNDTEETLKEVAYEGDELVLWPRSGHPEFQKPWRIPINHHDGDHDAITITGLVVWGVRRAPGV